MQTQPSDPDFLDRGIPETEAAEFLGVSVRTLQKWRVVGGGPVFAKISRKLVRYSRRDLLAFTESCRRTSTSDTGER